ncbi:LexA family transcriptional regulator [Paenibacillus taichungensis]|uniref:LexA family transcriptional regulator n=1 Tax=Paenibacillus taichungensis TaxID=484184 RepID=UPI0038290310
MNYSKLVDEYIKKSGLSLAAIAEKLHQEKGIKIDRSYISKLRNNPKYPATDEINRALAEVTGGDPEKLVMAAYIDRAPEEVKTSLRKVSIYENFLKYILVNKPLKVEFEGEGEMSEEEHKEAVEYVNSPEFLATLDDEELNNFLNDIVDDMQSKDKDTYNKLIYSLENENSSVAESISTYKANAMVKIPLLGQIAAGQPLDRIEYNEGYTLVDPSLLKGKEGFALKVKGDSMTGDRIHEGDLVIVSVQNEVHPHEIAVVSVNGEKATLKRVKRQNDVVMLLPSNPSYEAQLVPADQVQIIGKVVEVKFWPA